jgi:UDP-N-acetylmuramoyl-tripeptide--D-alanyl-D-alanine ligase
VIALTLSEIAELVGGAVEPPGSADVVVTAPASVDSRHVVPGGLFVAAVGENVDGHDFVGAALAGGAAASLVTRPVEGPQVVVHDVVAALGHIARAVVDRLVVDGQLQVVALTGSSGKTGTKDLLAQTLQGFGTTVATAENLNNELGVPLTALVADESTRHLVLEMGARVIGDIAYLTEVAPPRIGLVLNVGAAHLGPFGGKEAVGRAKSELVQSLPSAEAGGVAVLNADDELVAAMAAVTTARVVTFGTSTGADVRAVDVSLDEQSRPSFVLHAGSAAAPGSPAKSVQIAQSVQPVQPVQSAPVSLRVHGAHHVSNALGVAAVALALGMPLDSIATALSAAKAGSRWRMEVTRRPDGVTVVNDAYNANPDSMRAGLEALVAMARSGEGRTWAVLGEMLELGAASDTEHAEIGRLTRKLGVDRLVVVGLGARGIHAGAVADGARDGEDSVAVPDSQTAQSLLREALRPGDVVLFKSSRDAGLRWLGDAVAEETGA